MVPIGDCHALSVKLFILLFDVRLVIDAGNLALSRALGDFIFKKNDKIPAEEQMVSGK